MYNSLIWKRVLIKNITNAITATEPETSQKPETRQGYSLSYLIVLKDATHSKGSGGARSREWI